MTLKDFKTKTKYVKAIQWDGLDATYDALAPIISNSIASYVKLNGSDIGTLRIRKNSTDIIVVEKGHYIVILDEKIGTFRIVSEARFHLEYEPANFDTGLLPDSDTGVITPPGKDEEEEEPVPPQTNTAQQTLRV